VEALIGMHCRCHDTVKTASNTASKNACSSDVTMHLRMYMHVVGCIAMLMVLCCDHDNVSTVVVTAALTCHDHGIAAFMTTAMQSSVAGALCQFNFVTVKSSWLLL